MMKGEFSHRDSIHHSPFSRNLMKRITLVLTALISVMLFISPKAFAEEGTLQTANTLYENGRFTEAIQAYRQMTNQGIRDANLFFNLGNAYYQSGDLGRAILNYRRAEQISPRDPDIQHNLKLARQQTIDQINKTSDNMLGMYLTSGSGWLSLNETAVLTLTLWTLLCFLILASGRLRQNRIKSMLKYSLIPLVLIFFLALFTLGSRLYTTQALPEGVIVAQVTDIYTGPGSQFGRDSQLHAGTEVVHYQTRGNWTQIGLPGSAARGWVPATAVEPID